MRDGSPDISLNLGAEAALLRELEQMNEADERPKPNISQSSSVGEDQPVCIGYYVWGVF